MSGARGAIAAALAALGVMALAAAAPAQATGPRSAPAREPDAGDAFFGKGVIPRLRIDIAPDELAKLRKAPRGYVRCTIKENDKTVYKDVAVKLKGSAGSYRELSDKPGLTLKVDKFEKGKRFHALAKFHLNNSVQDETYLCEWISSEIFTSIGVPCARVSHARVWLNGRDLGLYVFKESFDKLFLARRFDNPAGVLYDGGFVQDVDADLQKDVGKNPDDRTDLKGLLAACREVDPAKRRELMVAALDVEAFLTFASLERIIGHWDGYAMNRNNYRLYFDADSKKAAFFPHGMDYVFADPEWPVFDTPPSIVAYAVLKTPEWKAAYRKRICELLVQLGSADRWTKRIDDVCARLRPVLDDMGPHALRRHEAAARGLKDRIVARFRSVKAQSLLPEPGPLQFPSSNAINLRGWRPVSETPDARLVEVKVGGERVLKIDSGPGGACVAFWRKPVLLSKGRYKFEAHVQTEDVVPVPGEAGGGAGVRTIADAKLVGLAGSGFWRTVDVEFEVAEEKREVELSVELRAVSGRAMFQTESLKVIRLPAAK